MRFLNQQPDTLLAEIGMLLYGDVFTGPLADELGVAKRTVERWANGSRGVPPNVWPKLVELLLEKWELLGFTASELSERCGRGDYPQRDPVAPELPLEVRGWEREGR